MKKYNLSEILDVFHEMGYKSEMESKMNEEKRVVEPVWASLKLGYKRSRWIYDQLRDDLIDITTLVKLQEMGLVDIGLLKLWEKNGYERLCCIICIQHLGFDNSVCVCRVPKKDNVECVNCGCRGCA